MCLSKVVTTLDIQIQYKKYFIHLFWCTCVCEFCFWLSVEIIIEATNPKKWYQSQVGS